MVSSSYYGSYGYPGYGYNQQGGSMLGNTSMSSAYSSLGDAPDLDPANVHAMTDGVSETFNNAMKPQEEKSGGLFGGIGDFFKGIVKGATNLVKSLADPKTWLMIGAAALLCFVFPPAGYALLALGLFTSGSQILGGLTSGNMEQVGEGTFNFGLTALGAKSMGGGLKGKDGATYTAAAGKAAKAADKADDAVKLAAQADDAVVAAKEAGKSADDIAALQKTAQQAHQHADDMVAAQIKADARVQYTSAPKPERSKLVDSTKPNTETLQSARNNLGKARVDLHRAESQLANKTPGSAGYTEAQQAVSSAREAVAQQTQALTRMEMTLQSQRGFFGRTVDSLKDSTGVIRGQKLVDPKTGQQITLYNRTPKTPGAETATQSRGLLTSAKETLTGWKDTVVSKVTGNPKPAPTTSTTPATSTTPSSTMPTTGGHRLGGESTVGTPQLTRQQLADLRAARYNNNQSTSSTAPSTTSSTTASSTAPSTTSSTTASSTAPSTTSSTTASSTAQSTTANTTAGTTAKKGGFLSQRLDPKTGQPIDKGAAGYWNYLTSHKMQSWVQGNTLGNMFGGQQGQGGGLFSMFGMGGGAQGQGGLLG